MERHSASVSERFMFPSYSRGERLADATLHVVGLTACVAAIMVLLLVAASQRGVLPMVSAVVYGLGVSAVFAVSAGYHLARRPGWKEVLRRLDHAAIFVMIAGSYTPFALIKIGGGWGLALLSVVWGVALLGIALKLLLPRRFERAATALYLAQGWAVLAAIQPLVDAVSTTVLLLLVIGGGLYTLGVVFHLCRRLPYHNAIWHAFVLAAAGIHYVAVLDTVAPRAL